MINRVVLVGRLTKDPSLSYTQSGIAVCRFTLACNRPFKSESGEQQADFINCVAWRKQAENVANYLRKGSLAGVDGRIQTGSFEGQDGKKVYTTEVVADSVQFLEPKSSNTNQSNQTGQYQSSQANYSGQSNSSQQNAPAGNYGQQQYSQPNVQQANDPFVGDGSINVTDDDLPF